MATEQPKRRRLNADQRREERVGRLRLFIQQYGRKAQKGVEPNDRHYERKTENIVKRMTPHELDRLLRDAEE